MISDLDKLMNSYKSTNDYVVPDMNMSCQVYIIGKDRMRSNDAIVCNMHICHQKAIIPYRSFKTCFCTAIDRAVFSDGHIITNFQKRTFTSELKILRCCTNDCTRIYITIATHPGAIENA